MADFARVASMKLTLIASGEKYRLPPEQQMDKPKSEYQLVADSRLHDDPDYIRWRA
jgi:hypothetical protein